MDPKDWGLATWVTTGYDPVAQQEMIEADLSTYILYPTLLAPSQSSPIPI